MTRYTPRYGMFVDSLDEILTIQRTAAALEADGPYRHAKAINAAVRGGVVLLCSHVEAYVKGMGELILEQFTTQQIDRCALPLRTFYFISQDKLREIRDTNDPDKISAKLFELIERDGSHWQRAGPFSGTIEWDIFETGFASPKVKNVAKFFGRFGLGDYKQRLAQKNGPAHPAIVNALDHLVDVRNSIAHGDITQSKTPLELGELTGFAKLFCRASDNVVADWCRDSLCSIRR